MIDYKDFQKNPEPYLDGMRRRGKKFVELMASVSQPSASLGTKDQAELQQLQAQINAANKVIPTLAPADKKTKIAEMKKISDSIAELKSKQLTGEASAEVVIPNIPRPDVPAGDDETGNVVLREVGTKPTLSNPRPYLEVAEALHLIDIKRAGKVSGSRFGYLMGPLAQLEFAVVQYTLAHLVPQGFTAVVPPVMIKEENMAAMGYLSGGGEDETYHFAKDGLYLVGTSEQSVGPMHRDEVFTAAELPRRYVAFSTCFRREAGSYGKDTKGILRVHQFDKLEMFSFTGPEDSDQEHAFLLSMEEELMQGLALPYRVVQLCAGDLGWPSARTYDIETWMPGQGVYRETHSTSTTTDYQSRALNIKVERGGKREYVHMLNGTAFAIGRILIAIIENYQQADGSIVVPEALRPYMLGLDVIR